MQTQTRLLTRWIINRVVLPMAETSQVENRLRAILQLDSGRRAVSRYSAAVAVIMTMAVLAPVALLRSAPASARLLTSQPSFEATTASASLFDTLPTNPLWARQVSKSVGVELVGVTEGWSKTAASWRPDGTRLLQPLYRRLYQQMQPQYPNKEMVREFAFRLTHPSDIAVETSYKIPVQGNSSFESDSGPSYNNDLQVTNEHDLNPDTSGFRVVSAVLPKSLSRVMVRVGVAAGPWHYMASCPPSGNGSTSNANADGSVDEVLFGHVIDSSAQSILVVSDTYVKRECRVIAIGKSGQVYNLHDVDVNNGQKFRVMTVKFDIPLTQIKEFRFQTRPYEWVEFKNVALEPSAVSAIASIQAKKDFIAAVRAHNQQVVQIWQSFARDTSEVYQNPDVRQPPKIMPRIFAPNYTLDGRHINARQAASVLASQARTYGLYRHSFKTFVGDMTAPGARVTIVMDGKKGSVIFSRLDVWIKTPAGWRLTESQMIKTVY